jgi:predicted permease
MKWARRLTAWLIERYPAEFRRAHERELLDASDWTLAETPGPFTAVRLAANLAVGVVSQHAAELVTDIRYARRTLGRSRWFAVCATLSLAIGIGTVLPVYLSFASTIFRNVKGVASPDTLLAAQQPVSYSHFEQLREDGPFAELTAYQPCVPVVLRTSVNERLAGHIVAPNYFKVLGVALHRGSAGAEGAVISHRLWQRRFGEQEDTIGRQVRINGKLIAITGVAPPDFLGSAPIQGADIWLPVTATDSNVKAFQITGRLRPGINKSQAEVLLDARMRHLDPQPGTDKARRLQLIPGARFLSVPDSMLPMIVGFPAVICVLTLWIACTNVGAMMLARAASRRKEVAVRAALGAGRGRIVRQLLTESLLLSIAGGVLGLGVTIYSLKDAANMAQQLPGSPPVDFSIGLDGVAVTLGAVLLSTLLCGLIPACQVSRTGVSAALKAATDRALPRYRWFSTRNHFIVQQVAAALCLLLLCAYLVLGISRSTRLDLGYDAAGLGTVSIDPLRDGFSPKAAADLLAKLPAELTETPGIKAAALAEKSPAALVMGRPLKVSASSGKTGRALSVSADESYFDVLGVPVLRGRTGATAVLVNEALVRELWPGGDPIGQTLEIHLNRDKREWHQVSGVVKDFRNQIFQMDAGAAVYLPLTASQFEQMRPEGWTLVVRAAPGRSALDTPRTAIASRHPDVTVFNSISIEESSARTMSLLTQTFALYGGLGLFGLLLSAVGLAGVTAYAVALRTREIGIRVALGATGAQVMRLVLREGVALLTAGAVAGLGLALLAERLLRGYLTMFADATKTHFGDPMLFAGGCALLAVLGLGACYLPARRAMRVDPVIALRE